MAELIDGKLVSSVIKDEIAKDVVEFKNKFGKAPALAVIKVGDDPASAVYVRNKHKACAAAGISADTALSCSVVVCSGVAEGLSTSAERCDRPTI